MLAAELRPRGPLCHHGATDDHIGFRTLLVELCLSGSASTLALTLAGRLVLVAAPTVRAPTRARSPSEMRRCIKRQAATKILCVFTQVEADATAWAVRVRGAESTAELAHEGSDAEAQKAGNVQCVVQG